MDCPQVEQWKLGQLSPGDRVYFRRVGMDAALAGQAHLETLLHRMAVAVAGAADPPRLPLPLRAADVVQEEGVVLDLPARTEAGKGEGAGALPRLRVRVQVALAGCVCACRWLSHVYTLMAAPSQFGHSSTASCLSPGLVTPSQDPSIPSFPFLTSHCFCVG